MENNNNNSGGITVLGLLGVVFIVLKLCGIISWSWLWVTAPFWIPLSIGLVVVIGILLAAFVIKQKKR